MLDFWTQLSGRDRRALTMLALALLFTGLVYYWPDTSTSGGAPTPEASEDALETAQRRRMRLEQLAATVPGKQEVLRRMQADLAARETGLIIADTPAQAQAQLLQTLRQVGRQQTPPLEIRSEGGGGVQLLGDSYGLVTANIAADCAIDALVNFLTDLTRQNSILATQDIRIAATQSKQKILNVRMSIAGVVPKRLAPEKKAAFR
jgi:hypothetical protein